MEERQLLWSLQQQLAQPTTIATLSTRLYLADRWHDLLRLEGFPYFAEVNPYWVFGEGSYEPEQARSAVNKALAARDIQAACAVVDRLLQQYDAASRHWFADESPGNIRGEGWMALERIEEITDDADGGACSADMPASIR